MSQDISMFGWIENAVGINSVFTSTNPGDIMFRTALTNNKVVIGNRSNAAAALYVSNNNVGIRKVCESNYVLDVNGSANLPIINTEELLVSTIVKSPCIENDLLIARDIKRTTSIIIDVQISSVALSSSNGAVLTLTFKNPADHVALTIGAVLKINNILYNVIDKQNDTTIVIDFYSGEAIIPFPIVDQMNVDIFVLDDLYKQTADNTSNTSTFFNLKEYNMQTNNTMVLNVQILDEKQSNYLKKGALYTFQGVNFPDNIFKLVVIQKLTALDYVVHFQHIDQSDIDANLLPLSVPNFNSVVKLSVVDIAPVVTINESVLLSQIPIPESLYLDPLYDPNSSYFVLSKDNNTIFNLPKIINAGDIGQYNPISKLTVKNANDVNALHLIKLDTDHVILNLPIGQLIETNDAIQISYSLYGTPYGISITSGDNAYVVDDFQNMLSDIQINDSLLILNNYKVCKVLDINIATKTITIDSNILDQFDNMIVYVLPYHISKKVTMTEDNVHVAGKLCVGTDVAWETLTVGGDASIQSSLIFNNKTKTKTFAQSFDEDVFKIGDQISITESNITMENDLFIKANSYAENFYNYSDRRIKNNIMRTTMEQDVEILNNLNVYEFTNKHTGKYNKGFVAQEVEEILPYAVHNEIGVLKSICRKTTVSDIGYIILDNITLDEMSDIKVGTPLQIVKCNGTIVMSPIVNLNRHNDMLYMRLSEDLEPGSDITVIGPYTNVKSVNYNTLFMSCFNCLKVALKDIEQLKQDMQK
jgi:hypothetical protein